MYLWVPGGLPCDNPGMVQWAKHTYTPVSAEVTWYTDLYSHAKVPRNDLWQFHRTLYIWLAPDTSFVDLQWFVCFHSTDSSIDRWWIKRVRQDEVVLQCRAVHQQLCIDASRANLLWSVSVILRWSERHRPKAWVTLCSTLSISKIGTVLYSKTRHYQACSNWWVNDGQQKLGINW